MNDQPNRATRGAATALSRPKIVVLAPYYLPGYRAGGPIRSIANIVAALGDELDCRIVTRDRDVGSATPYPGITTDRWSDHHGTPVFYASAQSLTVSRLGGIIRDAAPDVVYLNSVFDPRFSIRPLVARRLGLTGRAVRWIIAPRGEFSAGAIGLKRWKKRPYLTTARGAGLFRGITWQASTEHEQEDIERELSVDRRAIHVAQNLTEPVGELGPPAAPSTALDHLRICFLSRISPKKNLEYAIDAVQRARCPVQFDIYGPIEDPAYGEKCKARMAVGSHRTNIAWKGDVPHHAVRGVLAGYDLFLFPTLGENFGHAIFESLAAGVPVLISDRTPWLDLDQRGVGWVRSLDDPNGFTSVIEAAAALTPAQRRAMALRAHDYARALATSSTALAANRALFHPSLPPPA